MTNQINMPEAIASVTYTLETPSGFPILFTLRGESANDLLKTMKEEIEPFLSTEGFKAQIKSYGGFSKAKKEVETVPDRQCPKCYSPLVYGTTKDGKKFIKCSTQKYNFETKQKYGCEFFEWEK